MTMTATEGAVAGSNSRRPPHRGPSVSCPDTLADQDPELVHNMTKAMVERFPEYDGEILGIGSWALDKQSFELVVLCHEGTNRFFEEAGVWTEETRSAAGGQPRGDRRWRRAGGARRSSPAGPATQAGAIGGDTGRAGRKAEPLHGKSDIELATVGDLRWADDALIVKELDALRRLTPLGVLSDLVSADGLAAAIPQPDGRIPGADAAGLARDGDGALVGPAAVELPRNARAILQGRFRPAGEAVELNGFWVQATDGVSPSIGLAPAPSATLRRPDATSRSR